MILSIVVAIGLKNEIGAQGQLLWHLPKDMQYFKNLTLNHCVLMGKKTYLSIPEKFRPLPNRTNIVLSHTIEQNDKYFKVNSIQEAIDIAKQKNEKEFMLIGGGEVYRQFMSLCNKLYVTKVHSEFSKADTFFPTISPLEWVEESSILHLKDEKNNFDTEFIVYKRREKSREF